MLFPEAKSEQKRQEILNSDSFKKALSELEERRVHYLNTPIEPLPFSLRKLFYTEGDRKQYEQLYFSRRERLCTFALAALLYDRREDIEALEDAIWAICEEYTWILPAHTWNWWDNYRVDNIDLFSAETGSALSEINYLLGDKLDSHVTRVLRERVEERIINLYLDENKSECWEADAGNWAAVCAGNVGIAFIYLAPDRFELVRERIEATLDCYLSGFGEDGCCVEGVLYWNYGFGSYTYYAQLLREFSNGDCNLFSKPICEKIARFQQFAFLRKNFTVSFSDGKGQCGILPGLTQRIRDVYGEDIIIPETDDYTYHWNRQNGVYLRNFFWQKPGEVCGKRTESEIYYPSAEWFICNNSELSFAAKAGHNSEPHNHNDVGSFLLTSDKGHLLCDFGCGKYTRQYFDDRYRYDILCNGSQGHSVPIINGEYQQKGKEFFGRVIEAENGCFTADIASAYPECGITRLERRLSLSDNVFTLTDTFEFDGVDNAVTERFVTLYKPEIIDMKLNIEGFTVTNPKDIIPRITPEQILDHSGDERTLYLIDYTLENPESFTLIIK